VKTRRFTPTALTALSFIAALVWLQLFAGGLFDKVLTEPADSTQSLSRAVSAHEPPPEPHTLTIDLVGDAARVLRRDVDPDVEDVCAPGGDSDFPDEIEGITTAVLCAHSVYEGWSFMRWEWHDPYNDLMTSVDPNLPVTLLDENATRTAVFMRGHVEVYNGQGGDMVPEEDEVTVGAFTVPNLNDTVITLSGRSWCRCGIWM